MKSWKPMPALLLTLLLVIAAACGSNQPASTGTDGTSPPAQTNSAAPDSGPKEEAPAPAKEKIVLGFSQVGAESGWRTANTDSIKEAAAAAGIELKFSDAQQKQENQIKAIRSFIQQKVDVIAFSPVVESGWETVLQEAEEAGIPVILTDRAIDSEDDSLYVTFLGSDFVEEGRRAGQWLLEQFKDATEPVNIVELQGTTGSAPANDRKAGFEEVIKENPNLQIIASQTGDFTRAKGKEVMQSFLQAHKEIDVLYAHNDDMGLGAIQAIEAAGLVPGEDILIITVDAVRDGMQAAAEGKINFIVECNPLLGPILMQAVREITEGRTLPKRIVPPESVFTEVSAEKEVDNRQY